jgi:hypothetical protein
VKSKWRFMMTRMAPAFGLYSTSKLPNPVDGTNPFNAKLLAMKRSLSVFGLR